MATNNSGPKNPWASNDNPWAEMGRLNLQSKDVKTPAPEMPKSNSGKVAEARDAEAAPRNVAAGAVAAATDTASEVDYSVDDLQELNIKELQELARENGIDPRGLTKEDLIDAILGEEESLTSEESEVDEEIELSDEEELETEEIDGEMSLEEAMALLGEDSETEDDFSDAEFEEVEVEVQEGDASFEFDDNNSGNN